MRFGDLPDWATDLSRLIRKAVCFGETIHVDDLELNCNEEQIEESGLLPFDLLWREPLFDQLIANVYQPGEVRAFLIMYLLQCALMKLHKEISYSYFSKVLCICVEQ